MIRYKVQISIDEIPGEDVLWYHGATLGEAELKRLVEALVYEHTNAYESQIGVSVMRLGNGDSDHA